MILFLKKFFYSNKYITFVYDNFFQIFAKIFMDFSLYVRIYNYIIDFFVTLIDYLTLFPIKFNFVGKIVKNKKFNTFLSFFGLKNVFYYIWWCVIYKIINFQIYLLFFYKICVSKLYLNELNIKVFKFKKKLIYYISPVFTEIIIYINIFFVLLIVAMIFNFFFLWLNFFYFLIRLDIVIYYIIHGFKLIFYKYLNTSAFYFFFKKNVLIKVTHTTIIYIIILLITFLKNFSKKDILSTQFFKNFFLKIFFLSKMTFVKLFNFFLNFFKFISLNFTKVFIKKAVFWKPIFKKWSYFGFFKKKNNFF